MSLSPATQSLPRGPHRLTREEVTRSQRQRLLRAVTQIVAETGYASATITGIVKRAGVSPNAFYEHFATKEECFLAAYDGFAQHLLARVAAGLEVGGGWEEFVGSAARAYLGALDDDRVAACAFLVEMDAAGPTARGRRTVALAAFATLLAGRHRAMRARDPSLGELPERVFLGLSFGVRALASGVLDGSKAPLAGLSGDVVLWASAMIHGAAAAQEAARDA